MSKPREIRSEKELQYILGITEKDISETLIRNLFARKSPKEDPKYNTNDWFKLPVGACCNNKKSVHTTIGIYLFNRFIIEPSFEKLFGYLNTPITGDVLEHVIEETISSALYKDQIGTSEYADYLNRIQWLGGNSAMPFITPSITPALLKPPPGLKELKEKLLTNNREALESGDAIVAAKIEKELVEFAKKALKDDPGYENFDSKAKININNNYKTMNIMKGPLMDSTTGSYKINTSEYNTGITKDEYTSFADSAVMGAHSRAIGVAQGGYLAKKSNQTLNTIVAAPENTDCGTDVYLEIELFPELKNDYLYRYIKDGKTLVELTEDNIDKYLNTTVQMRSPMFCHWDEPAFCNICLGNQPYMIGLPNFGLAISRISNTLLNAKLKKFHDLTVKTTPINYKNVFRFIK